MLKITPTRPELLRAVQTHVKEIWGEKSETSRPLEVEMNHLLGPDLGLTSLDLAQLVAELEFELRVDPFEELVPITSVRRVEDLVAAYVLALSSDAPTPDALDQLLQSQRQAILRQS